MRRTVESPRARVCHGHDVLDAPPKLAGDIDPRLVAETHAGLERQCVALHQIRWLVLVEADAMSEPVIEIAAIASRFDDVARGPVNALAGGTDLVRRKCGLVCGLDQRVN